MSSPQTFTLTPEEAARRLAEVSQMRPARGMVEPTMAYPTETCFSLLFPFIGSRRVNSPRVTGSVVHVQGLGEQTIGLTLDDQQSNIGLAPGSVMAPVRYPCKAVVLDDQPLIRLVATALLVWWLYKKFFSGGGSKDKE